MAVVNRTLDSSQQRTVLQASYGAVATGVTSLIGVVPWPCVLDAAQIAAYGTSGSPTAQLVVDRFIVGTGFTTINLGSANALQAFGTSGVVATGASIPASGSTLNNLLPNDVLLMVSGGSNAAVKAMSVGLVLRPTQDIKQYFGGLV